MEKVNWLVDFHFYFWSSACYFVLSYRYFKAYNFYVSGCKYVLPQGITS